MQGRISQHKVCFPAHSPLSAQNLGLFRVVLGLGDEAFREKRVKRRQPPRLRRGGQRGDLGLRSAYRGFLARLCAFYGRGVGSGHPNAHSDLVRGQISRRKLVQYALRRRFRPLV